MFKLNEIIVTEIKDIITVYSPKGRNEQMTNRSWHGISFCKDGQITYIHNSTKYVSDPHHAVLLPQWQSYSIHGDKSGVFAVINFDSANLFNNTITTIPIENVELLMNDFLQMKKLLFFEGNHAKIMSLFYNIIHTLSLSVVSKDNILLPAITYIENNFQSTAITNAVLAAQCNISEVYFRKLFSKQYRTTPRQYIIDARINGAKQLLAEGTYKIETVAEKCGFSSVYHFCRIFKERVGITPTEYMKRNTVFKF